MESRVEKIIWEALTLTSNKSWRRFSKPIFKQVQPDWTHTNWVLTLADISWHNRPHPIKKVIYIPLFCNIFWKYTSKLIQEFLLEIFWIKISEKRNFCWTQNYACLDVPDSTLFKSLDLISFFRCYLHAKDQHSLLIISRNFKYQAILRIIPKM